MRIATISKTGANGGGASRFAEDLSCWLGRAGNDSVHFVVERPPSMPRHQRTLLGSDLGARVTRRVQRASKKLGLGLYFPAEYYSALRSLAKSYDVLHFHDHWEAYALASAALASHSIRTVFTAHDCLHMSGGCIYPLGCERFVDECGSCPQKNRSTWMDLSRTRLSANRRISKQGEIRYVYPSHWLMERAAKSLEYRHPPEWIPNGFDVERYKFIGRQKARQALGLDLDRKIVLVSANHLSDPRKGVRHALEALRAVSDLAPLVVAVGNPSNGMEAELAGLNFWMTGFVKSRERLGLLFAAADLFLFTTIEDNLPIAVQESMAAGTPVVGFATGGVPEMIGEEQGWMVPTGDQQALNAILRVALQSPLELSRRGESCRTRIKDTYSVEKCVERYTELYRRDH